jgi:hypothetical protein
MISKKNIGYFNRIRKDWFQDHQRILLFLCNASILKYWFRYVLRIHKDLSWKEKICELQPNNYKVFLGIEEDHLKLRVDFRTHNKFTKRIYFAFKYVWWAYWIVLHVWDWVIADRFVPKWSFGLTQLIRYPDPHTEVNTVDGEVAYDSADLLTWSNIITHAGNWFIDDGSQGYVVFIQAGTSINEYVHNNRAIALFLTSALTTKAVISGATLSFARTYRNDPLGATPNVNIYSSNPTSNVALQNSDYSKLGSTAFCDTPCTYANWATDDSYVVDRKSVV